MGRKIPGKKHHGVKDPEKQRQNRENKVKTKINAAPKDWDSQEIPKKMLRLKMDRSDHEEKRRKNNKQKNEDGNLLDSTKHMGFEMRLPGMKRPLKPVPVFKQRPGETQKRFFNRMEVQCKAVLKRKEYEEKYNVDVVDDPEFGSTKIQDREKDEIEEEMDEVKRKKLAKKGVKVRSKEEKRKLKRLKEKERKMKKSKNLRKLLNEDSDEKEFEEKQDVSFNDVVMQPPSLKYKIKGKEAQSAESRRPGAQKQLLLRQKLGGDSNAVKNKSAEKTKKRPEMSLAKKHMLEQERTRVVQLYRDMKAKNHVSKA